MSKWQIETHKTFQVKKSVLWDGDTVATLSHSAWKWMIFPSTPWPEFQDFEQASNWFADMLKIGAKRYAMFRLSKQNASKKKVCRWLTDAGFPLILSQDITHDMESAGYINENAISKFIVQEAFRKGKGSIWLGLRAQSKGVEIEQNISFSDQVECAVTWLKKQKKIPDNVIRKLLQRGFSYDVAQQALNDFNYENKE